MDLRPSAERYIDELADRYPALKEVLSPLTEAVVEICKSHLSGGKVLVCGNGGSASDSDHIVGELMKGFVLPRRLPSKDADLLSKSDPIDGRRLASQLQCGVQAIALTHHQALSSAVLNDIDPLMAFAQQAYVYGRPGDVLIGISTSGNAANVINAVRVANAFGLVTIAMTGSEASRLDGLCRISIKTPATQTYKIQEYHLPIYHALCLAVEEQAFGG